MKCIRQAGIKDTEIVRVPDERARYLTNGGDWEYCPKEEWKQQVRDVRAEQS